MHIMLYFLCFFSHLLSQPPCSFLSSMRCASSSVFRPLQEDGPSGRQTNMAPLVIPVSVPVHRSQVDPQGGWAQGRLNPPVGLPDRKPSVIVARRRSRRNSMTESFGQVSSLRRGGSQ